MNEYIRNDLKITGTGKSSGGFYNNVVINGLGDINGNIDCVNLRIIGSGSVDGNVKSATSSISGSSNIKGDIESGEFRVNGSSRVGGDALCKYTKVNGSLEIDGSLKGEEIQIRGSVRINNDCNIEKFDIKGGFAVAGLLSADDINAEIYISCKAKEIGGGRISIRAGHSFGIKRLLRTILNFLDFKEELVADLIEADDIFLERTKAKTVRGNNVIIGEGCEIDLVEYKNEFKNNGNSIVRENKRIV